MTIKDITNQYTQEILKSEDKETTTSDIIRKINNLTYSNSGEKISLEDKQAILNGIISNFTPKDSSGRRIILNEKENANYLTMLRAVTSELSKKQGGENK